MRKFIKILIFIVLYIMPLFLLGVLPFAQLLLAYSVFSVCLALINLGDLLSFFANFRYAWTGGENPSDGLYRLAILKDTTSPTAYLNYAIILMKQGDYLGALPHLKTARAINVGIETDKNILMTLINCYLGLGQVKQAQETMMAFNAKYGEYR